MRLSLKNVCSYVIIVSVGNARQKKKNICERLYQLMPVNQLMPNEKSLFCHVNQNRDFLGIDGSNSIPQQFNKSA